ncbi:hypothetical protein GCM10022270_18970 [Terriglobus aquaticus]
MNLEDKAVLTIEEAAALLGFSRQTATRLFENEPGVLILKRPETLHKRQYRCIRIPRAVFELVREENGEVNRTVRCSLARALGTARPLGISYLAPYSHLAFPSLLRTNLNFCSTYR